MSSETVASLIEQAETFHLENSGIQTVTLNELRAKHFAPVKWIVPELLPEGLTLLVGSPKIGKSWLALSICMSVAFGGYAINQEKVEKGEVLYLALEDSERRLQSRFEKIGRDNNGESVLLHFCTQIESADKGGIAALNDWLDKHPNCRLVIIDTLQRFRGPCTGQDSYSKDYTAMAPLQSLAIQRGIAVVLIHHTRKADASDPFDKISGTTALMGASDCTWLLERGRGEAEGKLYVTGRDVEENELALKFDPKDCLWSVIGDAKAVASSNEEREILDLLKEYTEPLAPREVEAELGISISAAKMRLLRMSKAKKIIKVGHGKYTHPDHIKIESHKPKSKKVESNSESVTQENQSVIPFPAQSNKDTEV